MKKLMSLVLGGMMMASCQPTVNNGVSGTLTGIESDSLLIFKNDLGARTPNQTDTIALKNNKFTYSVTDSTVQLVKLYPIPALDANGQRKRMVLSDVVTIPVLPGKGVQITGSLDNYKLSGDVFYDEMMKVEAMRKPYQAKLDSITALGEELQNKGVSRDSIMKVYQPGQAIFDQMNAVTLDYIRQNLSSELSLYLLSNLSFETIVDEFDKLDKNLANGAWASLYEMLKGAHDKEMARRKAAELVKEGCVAPDFTLKDLKGKDVSLSSLRGKVVVLDFWGSWCGWCIKGMPEMKKYYKKYHKKLEILGVACNDTDKTWRAAVEKLELPWVNVLNQTEPNVPLMYAIQGFPTKFVIGKDGKILKCYVGEDPEFYTFLDSILK